MDIRQFHGIFFHLTDTPRVACSERGNWLFSMFVYFLAFFFSPTQRKCHRAVASSIGAWKGEKQVLVPFCVIHFPNHRKAPEAIA